MSSVINLLNPFYWLVLARRFLFRKSILKSYKLKGVQVVSIGNIELGGTGKTPFVIAVAAFLKSRGQNPLILSRGYGSALGSKDSAWIKNGCIMEVSSKNDALLQKDIYADEAMLCSYYLPDTWILIGANRHRNFERFMFSKKNMEPKITHVILDDGFQHLKIKRDIDVVLLGEYSVNHASKLLPFGRLREPRELLRYADYCLWTGDNHSAQIFEGDLFLKSKARLLVGGTFKQIFYIKNSNHESSISRIEDAEIRNFCAQKSLVGIFGIAKSAPMLTRLSREYNLEFAEIRIKRDHQNFSEDDSLWIKKMASERPIVLISTLKDYFRAPEFFKNFENIPCLFLDKSFIEVFFESDEFKKLRLQLLEVE